MTQSMTKEKSNYKYVDHPLNYLISCRVKLREDQRETLKEAYNKMRWGKQESTAPLSGSAVSSVSFTDAATRLYQETGLSAVVIGDCLGSRESLSLPLVLKLQRGLGVTVVTQKDIEESMSGYAEYVFNVMEL